MLENTTTVLVMKKLYDMKTKDIVDIATSFQITFRNHQVRLLVRYKLSNWFYNINFFQARSNPLVVYGAKPGFCHQQVQVDIRH